MDRERRAACVTEADSAAGARRAGRRRRRYTTGDGRAGDIAEVAAIAKPSRTTQWPARVGLKPPRVNVVVAASAAEKT